MDQLSHKILHVVFLFSDTGGGHRSASEAIIEAINNQYGDGITCEMVDIFKGAPPPLNRFPQLYPPMARVPDAWEFGYRISNGGRRTRFLTNIFWPYIRRFTHRLIRDHPSDLYVSVHPLANTPVIRSLGDNRPPFMTVVTDMVTTHAFWYAHEADLILTPTEEARRRGIELGIAPEQIKVVGLPVADRFCQPAKDQMTIRRELGWPEDKQVILLVGGGEGMGPIERTAQAISESGLDVALVVITGRNRGLKTRLDEYSWRIPHFIYGFVQNMPDFMQASDIIITKAGPGTISEAFIAGLPIIIYSHMPGQEDGNITYVASEGAGVWAPRPDEVVCALRNWIDHPEAMAKAKAASIRLAKPDAARKIARTIGDLLCVQAKV
jgi:1,2-diacylglycerol 3-beta-galactosyltransferase